MRSTLDPNLPQPEPTMKARHCLLPLLMATLAVAADRPTVPASPIGEKKELLFSDDFESEPARVWHKVVPTFAVENGTLKGTQTRDRNIPVSGARSRWLISRSRNRMSRWTTDPAWSHDPRVRGPSLPRASRWRCTRRASASRD